MALTVNGWNTWSLANKKSVSVDANCFFFFLIFFFNVYLFLGQRETEHERGRGRKRGRHRIGNRLQALSHQPRAWRGPRTHVPRDREIARSWPGWSQTLNRLRHPGVPLTVDFDQNTCANIDFLTDALLAQKIGSWKKKSKWNYSLKWDLCFIESLQFCMLSWLFLLMIN